MVLNDLLQIKAGELASRKKFVVRCCMAAGCMSSSSKEVKVRLEKAVTDAGLQSEVEVRGVGCMRLCCRGPLVQVDPQNELYDKVTPENAVTIINTLKGAKAHLSHADPNAPFFKQQNVCRAGQQRRR
jgi:bidirectional [NiFe] hydrogenase diaphorase subunit